MRTVYCDPTDRRLIAQLEDNARISATELARRTGLARSTVHERIARLERDGIILGYSAIVAPQQDNIVRAILALSINQRQIQSVIARLRELPEIRSCHSSGGRHHLMCQVKAPTLDDLDALVDEIGAIPHVDAVDSSVLLATKFDRDAFGQRKKTAAGERKLPPNVTALHSFDRT